MLSIATHLVAFWDGKSSGTKHLIEIAQAVATKKGKHEDDDIDFDTTLPDDFSIDEDL